MIKINFNSKTIRKREGEEFMATYKKMYGNKADCPKKPEEFSLKQNNLVDEQFASIEKNIKVDFRKIFKAKKPINLILTATSLGKTLGMAV